ncbi:MAG: hypothetical protein JSU86_13830 [Phycisphaerales bacterium]|nr:MAG: hypothetical protein JSU86_13830 [Phycisphaerales bacterium]
MKTKALKGIRARNGYPLDPVRPVLREIIITSDDEELTESATLTLTSCYRHAKEVNERAVAEDIQLLKEVLQRKDLRDSVHARILGYVDRIEEKRRSASEKEAGD